MQRPGDRPLVAVIGDQQDDLRRHTDDIKNLQSGMNEKMGVETMWKVVGLVLTVGGAVGGVVGFLVHVLTGK